MEKWIFNTHDDDEKRKTVDRYHWLGDPDKLPFELPFTHLIHFTENTTAESIGSDDLNNFIFKPSNWELFDKNHSFVWWSAFPGDEWKDMFNTECIKSVNPKFYKRRFGKSRALNGKSLCGPIGFVVHWENIVEQYAESRKKSLKQIQLKVFGSFIYRQEIMYAILVCCEGDVIPYIDKNGVEKQFSPLQNETEAFRNDGKHFTWKVYCTTDGWVTDDILSKEWPRGTWDHLCFSFYFPDKNQSLKIPANMFKIKTKDATEFRPFSRENKSWRTEKEMVYDDEILKMLNLKIHESMNAENFK